MVLQNDICYLTPFPLCFISASSSHFSIWSLLEAHYYTAFDSVLLCGGSPYALPFCHPSMIPVYSCSWKLDIDNCATMDQRDQPECLCTNFFSWSRIWLHIILLCLILPWQAGWVSQFSFHFLDCINDPNSLISTAWPLLCVILMILHPLRHTLLNVHAFAFSPCYSCLTPLHEKWIWKFNKTVINSSIDVINLVSAYMCASDACS